jgi:D-hydroxyproline dehydrogenase subunit gamma
MFRLRSDNFPASVAVKVEGRKVHIPAGASAAAAMLAAGVRSARETALSGGERAPYCMMGICFDCLAEIDGVSNRQSCMVEVQPGMQIRRQIRARYVDPTE